MPGRSGPRRGRPARPGSGRVCGGSARVARRRCGSCSSSRSSPRRRPRTLRTVIIPTNPAKTMTFQSDAVAIYRKPERPRKLLPTRSLNQLTTNAYYNVLRKYCSVIPFSDFSCFSSLYSFFKCYSSTIVITHLVTSLYMCELMVQVSSSFVNKIRSTSMFSFSDFSCFTKCQIFLKVLKPPTR